MQEKRVQFSKQMLSDSLAETIGFRLIACSASWAISATSAMVLILEVPALAQNQVNLERALDQVSGSFSGYPARSAPYPGYPVSQSNYSPPYGVGGQQVSYPSQTWSQMQPGYAQQPQVLQQVQPMPSAAMSPAQRFRALYSAANNMQQSGAGPQMTQSMNPRQSLMHIFFGDGNSSYSGSSSQSQNAADQASKLQTAQENLSVARDQESRAENAESRASYGSDKSARRSAASEARYAARAARAAADRASAAGYGGGPAYDVAAQARAAADRARAAADRAEANASGGGW